MSYDGKQPDDIGSEGLVAFQGEKGKKKEKTNKKTNKQTKGLQTEVYIVSYNAHGVDKAGR